MVAIETSLGIEYIVQFIQGRHMATSLGPQRQRDGSWLPTKK